MTLSSDLLLRVASEEIKEVPDFMTECTMVYVPHVGYILAVVPWWKPDEPTPDLENFEGLKFVFCSEGTPHFKTKCVNSIGL
jgi:hypothetical protein